MTTTEPTSPEQGFATFARWQRKRFENRPESATGAHLAASWATGSSQWKAAWADVEDWHPAIREQVAVLNAASEAMEKLTGDRDGLRALVAEILAELDQWELLVEDDKRDEWRARLAALEAS